MSTIEYVSAQEWAHIIAKAWVDDDYKESLEKDPLKGVKEYFKNKPELSQDYNLDDGHFPRLFFIPKNPNYSPDQLKEVLEGKRVVVPIPGMVIHGRKPG
ncbi:MAG: hypothetical protein GWN00_31480 [Aliifodinibius sp.]|nr:nitrile hydratase subunit alpha [Fodinibius sp.]NIW48350.1 hypothetical protein [Gammaproteobacteria bacterium]NIW97759.1 hypothetical protein [Phycisphaerae bacterium]NIY29144.1 hypothetical protein [Fodinibius sp.]